MSMIIRSRSPLNAEPAAAALIAAFLTPRTLFYVRSHGEIPDAVPSLGIGGLVGRRMALSLAGLQSGFPHHTVTATLQCAGNRRAELAAIRPTKGDLWEAGAIGTAEWTGVRLGDVLAAAGIQPGAAHAAFTGRDMLPGHGLFTVSIPLEKATAPEVLLAWAMNGEPLPPEHGAPLRVVVPGYAGIRSAKWLAAVDVLAQPADSAVQRQDYKLAPPDATAGTVDWDHAATINALPVNSAICDPAAGPVRAGVVRVRGWAMASSRRIVRVDVSADAGQTWRQAALEQRGAWAWTRWETAFGLDAGEHMLVVRAWDEAGQTQPSEAAGLWNFKGYLCAAWHRVRVTAG